MLHLHIRSRPSPPGHAAIDATTQLVQWNMKKTALVICDVWDHHWCISAEARVGELVPTISEVVNNLRSRGVFILHAPSAVTQFYQNSEERKLAQSAPYVSTPTPLTNTFRWGAMWFWPHGKHEAVLPIDDSDDGCDCKIKKCVNSSPWNKQHHSIDIHPGDAVSDDGQEVWNVFQSKGIENVLICGVHLNICVMGRPFGIRQLVTLGFKVALIRDLTDVMYNPQRPPGVDHYSAIDLVVEHIERYWCGSIISTDITGKPQFRFKNDTRQQDHSESPSSISSSSSGVISNAAHLSSVTSPNTEGK